MKKTITLLMFTVLIAWSSAEALDPADYTGIVSVESIQAYPNESFGVKVRLENNNIDIAAMTLPLKYPGPHLMLDSVSLAGTIWTDSFSGYYSIDNVAKTVRVTMLPGEYVYPLPAVTVTQGVLAELFFTLADGATTGLIVIDSIFSDTVIGGNIHVYNRIDISDNSGEGTFQPGFTPGVVEVMSPTSAGETDQPSALPTEFALAQNYPNPFNPTTTIGYSVPSAGIIKLDVFNILGQQVTTLVDGFLNAGEHQVEFEAGNLPSGIYFYRLAHEKGTNTKKMILIK